LDSRKNHEPTLVLGPHRRANTAKKLPAKAYERG
jgi:hypothetical protein